MRLMFVYWAWSDQGSGNIIRGYTEAAHALGHEVVVYGPPNPKIPLNYSMDMESADAVVFVFEWTTQLQYGDQLDLVRLVGRVPRSRRVIIDGDGNYNDIIRVDDDYNHRTDESRDQWVSFCDSLSDKIYQPTLHPVRPNVGSFLFYAYDPAWERPREASPKDFTMLYIGHAKFRWPPMSQMLRAMEPVRDRFARLAVVGVGWDQQPWWASQMNIEDWYASDPEHLKRLNVEVLPTIPFTEVVDWMGKATFNPILMRPIFRRLRFVTPRFFETPAADTIPLFAADEAHVTEIYGERARPLVVRPGELRDQILDICDRPEHYHAIVADVRTHLRAHHSHEARLRRLVDIVNDSDTAAARAPEAAHLCG